MIAEEYLTLRLLPLQRHEEWRQRGSGLAFALIETGSGLYHYLSREERVGAGDVLVMNSAAEAKISACEDKFRLWTFSISLEQVFPLFFSDELSLLLQVAENLRRGRHFRSTEPVSRKCHELLRQVPSKFDLDHRSQLLRIVAAVLSKELDFLHEPRVGYVLVDEHIKHVLDKLTASDLLTLTVGELAKKFSFSRRHLNRLFRQHFGFSVAGLKLEMRMLKAVSLLRNPNAKIITIAEECGYNHLSLFNLCFKRRFGVSPGKWRKDKLDKGERNGTDGLSREIEIAGRDRVNRLLSSVKEAKGENRQESQIRKFTGFSARVRERSAKTKVAA